MKHQDRGHCSYEDINLQVLLSCPQNTQLVCEWSPKLTGEKKNSPLPTVWLLIKLLSIPPGSSRQSCHYQFGEVSWTFFFFLVPTELVLNDTKMKNLWGTGGFPRANSGLPSCYSPTLHSGNLDFKAPLWLWCIWVKKLEFIKFTPDISLCSAATAALGNVLVSWTYHNKSPKTGWLKVTGIYSLTVLEAMSLKSSCWQGHTPPRGPRGDSIPCLFQPMVTIDIPGLVGTSFCQGPGQSTPKISHNGTLIISY